MKKTKQKRNLYFFGDINLLNERLILSDESGKVLERGELEDTICDLVKEILLKSLYSDIIEREFISLGYATPQEMTKKMYEQCLTVNIHHYVNFSALWDLPETPLSDFSTALFTLLMEMDKLDDVPAEEQERVIWLLAQVILCCVAIRNYDKCYDENIGVTISYIPDKPLIRKGYIKSNYMQSERLNYSPLDTWNDNYIVCAARFVAVAIIENA